MFFKAFLISIFSDVCKIQALIPALAAIKFQKMVIVVSAIGLFSSPSLLRNVKSRLNSPAGRAFVFLTAWMIISLPFSVYPGNSFKFITEVYWKSCISLFLILAFAVSIEALDKMIWAGILAASIFAVNAYVSGGTGRFSMIEAYDPNENALLFVLFLPFVFWKIVLLQGWKKIFMAGIGLLIVMGIMETESRGGFLGLLSVVLVTVAQFRRVRNISLIKLLVVPAVVLIVIFARGGSSYIDRVKSTFDTEGNYNYSADTGRIAIWKQGIDMMIDNPLFGVGVQQFITAQGRTYRSEGGKWQAAHNSFVQVGAELGFPGLIAFIFIIAGTVRQLRNVTPGRNIRGRSVNLSLITSYALIGSWTGYVVCGFFLSVAYSHLFYLLLGLSFSLIKLRVCSTESAEVNTSFRRDGIVLPVSP
jgi:O-antigen ligase